MKQSTIDGGIKLTTFHLPQAGFDPLRTGTEGFKRFGLPAVPEEPHLRERYQRVFKQVKHKLAFIAPELKVDEGIKFSGVKPATGNPPLLSSGFSGGLALAPAGESFKWIQGDWVIPNLDAPVLETLSHARVTLGINNFFSGIHCQVIRHWNSISRVTLPFIQFSSGPEMLMTNFGVSPGDMITSVLCTPQGRGATEATMFFLNRTTGVGASVGLTVSPSSLVSDEALWVVEAPQINLVTQPLADFGEVFFSECEAVTTGNTIVNGGSGFSLNMEVPNVGIVATGNLISPTVIQSLYQGPLG